MTLQLSIPPEVEAKLRQRAASQGKGLEQFVQQAVVELANEADTVEDPATLSPEEQLRRFNEWAKDTQATVAKTLPPGHFVDDSRESIY
jgi:hypothetical protein